MQMTLSASPDGSVVKNKNNNFECVFFAKVWAGNHCETGFETDSYQIESYNVIMIIREMASTH